MAVAAMMAIIPMTRARDHRLARGGFGEVCVVFEGLVVPDVSTVREIWTAAVRVVAVPEV
jgi:hypothetical protein